MLRDKSVKISTNGCCCRPLYSFHFGINLQTLTKPGHFSSISFIFHSFTATNRTKRNPTKKRNPKQKKKKNLEFSSGSVVLFRLTTFRCNGHTPVTQVMASCCSVGLCAEETIGRRYFASFFFISGYYFGPCVMSPSMFSCCISRNHKIYNACHFRFVTALLFRMCFY